MVKSKFDKDIRGAYTSEDDGSSSRPAVRSVVKPRAKPKEGRVRTLPGEHVFRQTLHAKTKLLRRLERNYLSKKGGDSLLAAKQMFAHQYASCYGFEQQFQDMYNREGGLELEFPHADPFCAEAEAERAARVAAEAAAKKEK